MSMSLSSMFLIIISSFSVVIPLKFCVTAMKLAASLCCPIRQGGVGVDAPADVIYSTRGACLPAIAPGGLPPPGLALSLRRNLFNDHVNDKSQKIGRKPPR